MGSGLKQWQKVTGKWLEKRPKVGRTILVYFARVVRVVCIEDRLPLEDIAHNLQLRHRDDTAAHQSSRPRISGETAPISLGQMRPSKRSILRALAAKS